MNKGENINKAQSSQAVGGPERIVRRLCRIEREICDLPVATMCEPENDFAGDFNRNTLATMVATDQSVCAERLRSPNRLRLEGTMDVLKTRLLDGPTAA